MIRRSDWALLGLGSRPTLPAVHLVPTSGAAQPFRDEGEMFPRWASRPRRTLTLGLLCSLHWGTARKLLADFRAAHPDVDLVVEDLDDVTLREELDACRIDAAIAPEGSARREWRQAPLWRERLIAVLPEGHALAVDNSVTTAGLRGEIILLAGDGGGDRALQKTIVQALGGAPAGFMHHPVERDTLFDLVALGMGVSVSPGASLGAFYPGVCLRPILSDTAEIGYGLVWRADARNEALEDLIRLAETVARTEAHHAGTA
ncbi:LysR family substrate-binding domain-containing protein [Phenylobacterium sp.]|uniref:LysR family substrate-binding domain-containing protein n=1 Tax=Phenylobacterium sp. TaxID=1871053 RepID=UPI0025F80FB4|nr:LysR family substrate-binding domain-containing protein [Phenylobacterium sp.]